MTDEQALEDRAHKIARCVRGCATDDQYCELVDGITAALVAQEARARILMEALETISGDYMSEDEENFAGSVGEAQDIARAALAEGRGK